MTANDLAGAATGTAVLALCVLGILAPGTNPGGAGFCIFVGLCAMYPTFYCWARVFGARE